MQPYMRNLLTQLPRRLLKLSTHFILFFLCVGIFTFIIWTLHRHINSSTLPLAFISYCIGVIGISKLFRTHYFRSEMVDLIIFLLVCFLIVVTGLLLFSHTHDTSYDGQSYHQSAIISLIKGWNPLQDSKLPIHVIQGEQFVQGYPKLFWIFYATFIMATGSFNGATVLNTVPLIIGFSCAYYFFSTTLRLSKWSLVLAILAALQIHFMQQVFTFMADGTSYELGLGAIALLGSMLVKKKTQLNLAVPFVGLLIILFGTKFNNVPLVLLLSVLFLIHFYKTRAFKSRRHIVFIGSSIACALIILWSPLMTNYLHHHSFIYPMNIPQNSSNLRYDNIPPSIRSSNAMTQLFYGIFSSGQPSSAGDAKSPDNVARLKIPFTFTQSELASTADFLGRVGAEGVLFSGAVVASILFLIMLVTKSEGVSDERVIGYSLLIIGLLFALGIINPVPNKLRYAPFITLLPLVVTSCSLLISKSKDRAVVMGRVLLFFIVTANIVLSITSITSQRIMEFSEIDAQNTELHTVKQPIGLVSHAFSSVSYQLETQGVHYTTERHCTPNQKGTPVASTFETSYYCFNK